MCKFKVRGQEGEGGWSNGWPASWSFQYIQSVRRWFCIIWSDALQAGKMPVNRLGDNFGIARDCLFFFLKYEFVSFSSSGVCTAFH